MRAQSMNVQFTNDSRQYVPQSKQQRYIQEDKSQQNIIKKYPNYAYALTTENSYVQSTANNRFGQGLIALKNKSANNKRPFQPVQKMISSNGFNHQDMPQLSGSFSPMIFDTNQRIIQKQQKYLESMQANSNIMINKGKLQQNNRNMLPTGTFYSRQNQVPSPLQKKQSIYNENSLQSENQTQANDMKSQTSNNINEYTQGKIIENNSNYQKLRDVIQYDKLEKIGTSVIDASIRKQQQDKKKQLELFPMNNNVTKGKDGSQNNQISIFTQSRINTSNQIENIYPEEEEWDMIQLRQIGQTTNQQEQSNQADQKNEQNLLRQSSLDLAESNRKQGFNSMVKSNIIQSNQNNQRFQLNSPSPVQQKAFLSPQRNDDKLTKSIQHNQQLAQSQKSALVKRSYSAVKNSTSIKKEEIGTNSKKINPNDLMILKIKEQCTYKKYIDPIRIKKEKAKLKQQSEAKNRKINFTSTITAGYHLKSTQETQSKMKSLKDSMVPDDQLSNNLDMPAARQCEEDDDDDDDSMVMSNNDISLDLDDDEDESKQVNSPHGGLASTSDSIQNNSSQKHKVSLLKSVYQGRPSTIFFPYHKSCQQPQPRDTTRAIQISDFETKKFNLKYKINGENPYKCVVKAFEEAGFEMTEENDWNCVWSLPKKDRVKFMNQFQKQNHFPGCWNLGRKDFMWRCLNRVKRKCPKEMDFVPNTYLLCNSGDWDRFLARRDEASKNTLWILKPADQACGRGVKVISKTTKVKRKSNRIICDYIANPHLINGLKYDLRLYVLVTSYDPLRIYLYEEGLTRFATEKYNTSTKEISKRFVHLTNYSVNKHAKKFVKNTNPEADGEGSKWSLTALKAKYKQMGINVEELFGRIKDIIIKTCISAEPQMLDIVAKSQEHRTNCFELYGFDILIDSSLKPWILEVNVCPSLSSSSPLDRKIKHSLLVDVLNIIGITPYDKKQFTDDKKNNLFTRAFSSISSTMLDCNDSEKASSSKKNFSKNINDIQDLNYENCLEKLSPENWEVLFETDEEFYRRGHFERIYPLTSKEKLDYYQQFFDFQRFNNVMVQKWITSNQNFLEKILKKKYKTVV
ncbi:hypothetical protein ABPG74_005371 [Tetrahymena malaccensis]